MNRLSALLVVSLVLILTGCHSNGGGFQGPRKRVELTGAIIKEPVSGNFVFVDFRDITVNNNQGVVKLPVNKRIRSRHILKMELEVFWGQINQMYTGLVGPNASSGGIADFAILNSPTLKVYVTSGWALFWGKWPIIKAQHVYAGPDSTTVYVEELADKTLLAYIDDASAGADIPIFCKDSTSSTPIYYLKKGQFATIKVCTVSETGDYLGSAYEGSVRVALEQATRAGYPTP